MSGVVTITDKEFATQVQAATETTLVYFWASWCGPCRLMAPIVDWAAQTYGDRLKVVKMEVDPNPAAVAQCKVEGVPALRLFKAGKLVDALEGAISKQKLAAFLESYL